MAGLLNVHRCEADNLPKGFVREVAPDGVRLFDPANHYSGAHYAFFPRAFPGRINIYPHGTMFMIIVEKVI